MTECCNQNCRQGRDCPNRKDSGSTLEKIVNLIKNVKIDQYAIDDNYRKMVAEEKERIEKYDTIITSADLNKPFATPIKGDY